MENIHLIGILCIIGGCGLFGCMQAQRKYQRLKWLRQLEWNLHTLEQKIRHLHMPLALALKYQNEQEKDEIANSFAQWGELMEKDRRLSSGEAWDNILKQQKQWDYLENADKQLLYQFACQIGRGCEEDETRLFRFILEAVKNQQEESGQKIRSESRLWNYGGFMTGILIVLLFL